MVTGDEAKISFGTGLFSGQKPQEFIHTLCGENSNITTVTICIWNSWPEQDFGVSFWVPSLTVCWVQVLLSRFLSRFKTCHNWNHTKRKRIVIRILKTKEKIVFFLNQSWHSVCNPSNRNSPCWYHFMNF